MISFRRANSEDLDEIAVLVDCAIKRMEREGILQWDDLYPTRQDFEEDIAKGILDIGLISGKIAVVYAVSEEYDEQYRNGKWRYENSVFKVVHRLCVHPDFQNRGVAGEALDRIEKTAAAEGTECIRLDVYSKNPYALKLYESKGYVKVGEANWRKGLFCLMEKRIAQERPEDKLQQFPPEIQAALKGEAYQLDDIGMSKSSVCLFRDKVLKIQECGGEAENEYQMMRWLQGKVVVPEIYAYERKDGKSYLLMSRLDGAMSCDEEYMADPERLVKMLAKGLKNLWSVDISGCPADNSLVYKLKQAEYNVENNLVDLDNVEPETFGKDGFESPAKLLQWLYDNRPEEERILSHGDYCLPNIFFMADGNVGYIDLGKAGIADKWCDIALCCRSLSYNLAGKYNRNSGKVYAELDRMRLFEELGIQPDWDKIRYYLLLDELF